MMPTGKERQKIQIYHLVDKIIINENTQFPFNIYGKSLKEEYVQLILEKNTKLNKEQVQNLVSLNYLYVHTDEKELYEKYYNGFIKHKIIPKDMKNFYKDVGNTIHKMFENPEALGNVKEVEHIVTEMVSTILSDDFTVSSFISILESDYYTHTHSLNVSVYALCLGKYLGFEKEELEDLGTSALLHDLGKSKISKDIVEKNGKLTEHEFNEMKKHPMLSWILAKQLGISNAKILKGIRNHHEKLDGSGYPDKLKNEQINNFARIIAVCDVFDALTTKRSYKDPVPTFETLLMMKKEMSHHLDMDIVNNFIQIFKDEINSSST